LHHVHAQASGGDLTCIAWNAAAEDPFMFATGSHDGGVRIWTPLSASVRDSQTSFVIDVRAPSPGVASFIENRNPSPAPSLAPSLSPNTSGRTTPSRSAQALFAPDTPFRMVDSPTSDSFGLAPPAADFGDVVRQAIARSRPASPEHAGVREGDSHTVDAPTNQAKRVNFQTPPKSSQ
jgi:hypothetical protein